MSEQRIMYVCSECADNNPEGCGHFDPNDLRVLPDGRWLCESCFDDTSADEEDFKCWSDLSAPPQYAILPQRMRDAVIEECAKHLEACGFRYSNGFDVPENLRKLKDSAHTRPECGAEK